MRMLLLFYVVISVAGCAIFREDTLEDVVESRGLVGGTEQQQLARLKQHYELGEKYYKEDKLVLAATEFKSMLVLRPEDESALYRLGNIAFKEGNLEKSAAFFEKVIRVNPRNDKAHYNLATVRLVQSQNHFKYYAALAGKGVDLSGVSMLLGDIDKFSSHSEVSQEQNSLDKLMGTIKSR